MRTALHSTQPETPAVGTWIGRHQTSLWRFLRFLGCDAELAEDLAQDALVAALEHDVARLADAQAALWLRTTARRLWIDELRRRKRRPPPDSLEHVDPALLERAFARCEGEDQGGAFREHLERCLAGLDARQRRVLELRYRERAGRGAMAHELGIAAEGVKALLRRVRERVRVCIERRRAR